MLNSLTVQLRLKATQNKPLRLLNAVSERSPSGDRFFVRHGLLGYPMEMDSLASTATSSVQSKTFRLRFYLGALLSFGVIALAIMFQHKDALNPCPLCIFQRIAFAATGLMFLIGALWNPLLASRRRIAGVLALIPALVGIGIAWRHVWMTHLPADEVPQCGPGLEYMMNSMGAGKMIRSVLTGSGECAVVDWRLLGLSMPEWSLLVFVGLALWALLAIVRAK